MDGIRNTVKAAVATAVIAATALAATAPADAATARPLPGASYKGTLKGGTVRVKVKSPSRARVRYAMRTKCGRAHGAISVKIKSGRFHSTSRSKTPAARGRFTAGGRKAKGTLTVASAKRSQDGCELGSRRFTAKLTPASSPAGLGDDSGLSPSDYGHYAGANGSGRSVSFDVVKGYGGSTVENFAVDVDTDCWGDYDRDGTDDNLLAHVTGFGGDIKGKGSFDIYYVPDEDTEFEFSGRILDGQVDVDVTVGGHFDPDGRPNVTGLYECDSWGDTYAAAHQG